MSAAAHASQGPEFTTSMWNRGIIVGIILLGVAVAVGGAFLGLGSFIESNWHDAAVEYEDSHSGHHHWSHIAAKAVSDAGKAIVGIFGIFGGIYLIMAFYNANTHVIDDHHDDHGHHGSSAPIIISIGVLLFVAGFPAFADAFGADGGGIGTAGIGATSLVTSVLGLIILTVGIAQWWQEDSTIDGSHEMKATGTPFEGQDIRKAGMWIFLMSELMVFGSFFSSYLRMRTSWTTHWTAGGTELEGCGVHSYVDSPGVELCANGGTVNLLDGSGTVELSGYVVVASEYVAHNFLTLLPGAINTFALIISSYTIVLALRAAKDMSLDDDVRHRRVRNYLIVTLALGTMFLILKLVEWGHLVDEGFTLATGGMAASIFYVTTGAHGMHVFIGLLILLFYIFKADTKTFDGNPQGIEYFGLYWHFVDLAWVVIFPAFYLY